MAKRKKEIPPLKIDESVLVEIDGRLFTRRTFIQSYPDELKHSARCLWEGLYLFRLPIFLRRADFDLECPVLTERP